MKLYFDTMLWVFYFEGHPQFGPPTRAFVNRMRASRADFLVSNFILAETLVLPKRNSDTFTAAQYRLFFGSSFVKHIAFDIGVAERFADLRSSLRVKPADALHLAFAASASADYFVTHDLHLLSLTVSGIGAIVSPGDVP